MAEPQWTEPADIRRKVGRRWADGTVLEAYLRDQTCPVIDIKVTGPAPREIAADWERVQRWLQALAVGSRRGHYALVNRGVGGRAVGRNTVPDRAVIDQFDQVWQLLGVAADIARVDEAMALTRREYPELVEWVAGHGATVIAVAPVWGRLLTALRWLVDHGGSGRFYLREIDAYGVDTKFVEQHRAILAALLDLVLPAERIVQSHNRSRDFALRYGFQDVPELVRIRCDVGFLGLPASISELALRPTEAARLPVSVQQVLIVENQVTYLAAPVPPEGVVIWGAGFSAGRLGRFDWLRKAPVVRYAGDLDTHGFAILSMVRGLIPQVESVLMDRATLLHHRDRWGTESSPGRARLDHLTTTEQALYQELVEDVHTPALRLEQERLEWSWAAAALSDQDEGDPRR